MNNRKEFYSNTMAILFLFMTCLFSACGSDDDGGGTPNPNAEQLTALINNNQGWVLGTVTKDNYDVSDQFAGFKLSFNDGTYSTDNSLEAAWAKSGTWIFEDNNSSQIRRDDGVLMDISINNDELTINFTALAPGGRLAGIAGDYRFELVSE